MNKRDENKMKKNNIKNKRIKKEQETTEHTKLKRITFEYPLRWK